MAFLPGVTFNHKNLLIFPCPTSSPKSSSYILKTKQWTPQKTTQKARQRNRILRPENWWWETSSEVSIRILVPRWVICLTLGRRSLIQTSNTFYFISAEGKFKAILLGRRDQLLDSLEVWGLLVTSVRWVWLQLSESMLHIHIIHL